MHSLFFSVYQCTYPLLPTCCVRAFFAYWYSSLPPTRYVCAFFAYRYLCENVRAVGSSTGLVFRRIKGKTLDTYWNGNGDASPTLTSTLDGELVFSTYHYYSSFTTHFRRTITTHPDTSRNRNGEAREHTRARAGHARARQAVLRGCVGAVYPTLPPP